MISTVSVHLSFFPQYLCQLYKRQLRALFWLLFVSVRIAHAWLQISLLWFVRTLGPLCLVRMPTLSHFLCTLLEMRPQVSASIYRSPTCSDSMRQLHRLQVCAATASSAVRASTWDLLPQSFCPSSLWFPGGQTPLW